MCRTCCIAWTSYWGGAGLHAQPGQLLDQRAPGPASRKLSFYVAALGLSSGKPDVPLATDGVTAAGSPDQRLGR